MNRKQMAVSVLGKRNIEEPEYYLEQEADTVYCEEPVWKEEPKRDWFCRDFAWEEPHHKSNGTKCEEFDDEDDETSFYNYEEDYIASHLYKDGVDIDAYYAMLDRDLDDPLFKPNKEMEQLDEDLRVAYETPVAYPDDGPRPTREDGAHEEQDEEQFIKFVEYEDEDKIRSNKMVEKYKETLNISASEAFELLRRCHYCGTSNMKFGDLYCGERCQSYHFDFNYPCYWNQERWQNQCANNCVMCNWDDYYKNPGYDM